MSGAQQRAAQALKQAAAHPQVQTAIKHAEVAQKHAHRGYEAFMKTHSQYVLGSSPSFFVTKDNVWRYAVFTTLSQCAPQPPCRAQMA